MMSCRLSLVSLLGWVGRAIPILLMGTIAAYAAAADKADSSGYCVCVSATAKEFDDPKSLRAGFGDFGGDAIIYVNGDPVSVHRWGGVLKSIDQWVQKGPNTIAMGGNYQKPLYVKVGNRKAVADKAVFRRDAKPDPGIIEFQVDTVVDAPQRGVLQEDEASRSQYAREIQAMMDRLKGAIAAHNRAELITLIQPGFQAMAQADPDRKAEYEAWAFQSAETYSDPKITVEADAMPNLQMVFGRRCVLVYCNEGSGIGSEYAMRVHKGQELLDMPPMCFVRIRGEWMIW